MFQNRFRRFLKVRREVDSLHFESALEWYGQAHLNALKFGNVTFAPKNKKE